MTVLNWIHSDTCRYKVFVANRITEILEYSTPEQWRYVDSTSNPADDLTRGKSLADLAKPNCWTRGPAFLYSDPEQWPKFPSMTEDFDATELRNTPFCGLTSAEDNFVKLDVQQYKSWNELVEAVAVKSDNSSLDKAQIELLLLRQAQRKDFAEEYGALQMGKSVPSSSRLYNLAPEFDPMAEVIRVGGRLQHS